VLCPFFVLASPTPSTAGDPAQTKLSPRQT
jgi:hypothetical protein